MTQATPGPYCRDNLTVYALQESGDPRCPMVNRWSAHVQSAPGTPDDELEAVAVLFEAAPALLTSARELNEFIRSLQDTLTGYLVPDGYDADEAINRLLGALDGPEQRRLQKAAFAAIAKAEGVEP